MIVTMNRKTMAFGGKYLGAPHSMGFVCGKKDLIGAVTAHGFIGTRSFGRGMKADRQGIIGLVTALESWLKNSWAFLPAVQRAYGRG